MLRKNTLNDLTSDLGYVSTPSITVTTPPDDQDSFSRTKLVFDPEAEKVRNSSSYTKCL